MSFKNKVVVVTGGAKGIGGSCSKVFHESGADVKKEKNLQMNLVENHFLFCVMYQKKIKLEMPFLK
jgi:short-subunit dehydrogenase involved in D-alanine esterification of teichoic acids